MAGDALLVFVKRPLPGKVKTRLAATLGAAEAARLYGEWIGQILRGMAPLRPRVRVIGFFAGGNPEDFSRWDRLVDEWWPQPDGDLGARLDHAFRVGHCQGGIEVSSAKVLAIGSDCLELDAELIRQALRELESNDVVIGPARDGGYYLIGTGRWIAGAFDRVRWSSDRTFGDQRERCFQLGLSVALLPVLGDIDTEADWQDYQRRQAKGHGEGS